MTTPEGKVVALIRRLVEDAGGTVRKCSWENRRGAPDLLILLPNVHAWVEVKADKGQIKPHQLREHRRLMHSGCKVYVVFGEDQARALVNHLVAVSRSGEKL